MVNVPPDIALKAIAIKSKYLEVRDASPNFVSRALREAERYNGLHLAYWRTPDVDYLVIFRLDRKPNNEEVLPWLQALFGKQGNGTIHEWAYANYRFFFEGDVYSVDSVADMIGKSFADAAEKTDSNAGEFDLDKTDIGKKLLRNGNGG